MSRRAVIRYIVPTALMLRALAFVSVCEADGTRRDALNAAAGPGRDVSATLREIEEAASLGWCARKAGVPRLVVESAEREAALIGELASGSDHAGEIPADDALRAAGLLARAGDYEHALAVLDAAGADTVSGDALFLKALCLESLGRCGEAAEAYGAYSSSERLLGDYALFFEAECLGRRGGPSVGLDALRRLVGKWRHSPLWAESALKLCECYLKLGRFEDCIKLAGEVSSRAPSGLDRRTASYHMARALEKAGRVKEALTTYWEVVEDHPAHPKAGTAFRSFVKIKQANGLELTSREKYLGGVALSKTGNLGEAYELLERLASDGKSGPYRGKALEEMARISYVTKRYSVAARLYESLARAGRMDADEAMLWVGKSLIRSGDHERAFEILEEVGSGVGSASVRAEALWETAREKESLNRIKEAAGGYRLLAENLASSSLGPAACWRWGFCMYLLGDLDGALGAFDKACRLARAPYRSAQALYWKGKVLARLGRRDDAEESLRMAASYGLGVYYGARAAWALEAGGSISAGGDSTQWGLEPGFNHGRDAPAVPEPDAPCVDAGRGHPGGGSLPPEVEPAVDPAGWHFSRGTRLLMWGRSQAGARELRKAAGSGYSLERVLDALSYYGEYRQAMLLGGDSPPSQVSGPGEEGCYIKFPLAFAGQVWARSAETGLDPFLTLAVMRQESRFDRGAVSWAGAYGLMQLMPSTAKRIARRAGRRWLGTAELLDPDTNIEMGTMELRRLFEDIGMLPGVLAGYNAGPDRARRWAESAGGGEFDTYIETIGYRQTRDYVKLVLRDYLLYLRLYGGPVGSH